MAVQETNPPRNMMIGYKELASNRVTRIETILEQQRGGTTAPDTP